MSKSGESLIRAAKEALAHARDEIELPERIVIVNRNVPFDVDVPDPEREPLPVDYPGVPIYDVLEAEQDQHAPPKRKVEGSTPSEDSNSDNL